MKIKAGETRYLVRKIETEKSYDNVRFRLTNKKNTIEKSTDAEAVKDKVIVQDGVFLIPLQQQDTVDLVGSVTIEAEIDYKDKSVRYTDYNALYVNESLGWEQITGSKPSDDDGIEPVMEAIEQGIYVIVGPESSQELINAVTGLFQDTKQIAQSVRDDADAGEFDGQDGEDGYSPQVTVKTKTPSTYVLHIKDADHEYDTPNLQGQGGEGSIEVGDGLKREGNVVSVDLQDSTDNALDFSYDGALRLSKYNLGHDSDFRTFLADSNYNNPLASKSYVDEKLSGRLKKQIVTELPTEDIDKDTIYMILRSAPTTNNIYDEYLYVLKSTNPDVYDWELIGSTEVDLSNYYTKSETYSQTEAQNLFPFKSSTYTKREVDYAVIEKAFRNLSSARYIMGTSESNAVALNVADYTTLKITATTISTSNKYKLDNGTTITFARADLPLTIDVSSASKFYAWCPTSGEYLTYDLTNTDYDYVTQSDLADYATQTELASKVDKVQSENNELTLNDNTETSEISVGDYSFLSFDTSHLENDDVLTMYYKIGNTWDSKTISHSSWYEYVFEYDAIKFKVVTTPSGETREFKYSLYNEVIRQRQYSREIGNKQDKITSSNKLSADNVDDTNSTNKFVPTSTSADNGKFLRVVNGVATWQTVPQAESNSF